MDLGCSLFFSDALAIKPQKHEWDYRQTVDHSKDRKGDIVAVLFTKW